ncbi:MAG: ABC transporter permease subunit, partial [Actinomycetota bacterium]
MPASQRGSSLKSFLIGAGAFAALLGVTQLLPGAQGADGTPPAILFTGLVVGFINALVAAGVVLIYRTTRIINFAQASIGAAGGVFTFNLVVDEKTSWPFFPALVAGVLIAGIVGVAIELAFVRRFFNAPRLVLTVVTIALIQGLGSAGGFIQNLPLFTRPEERSIERDRGLIAPDLPFRDFDFQIGDLGLRFGFPH